MSNFIGSVTFKHFIRSGRAIEGLGYFWDRGARFTALYEFHKDINDVPGLQWYVGPGAHLGFYNKKKNDAGYGGAGIGIDGVIGLDYKINNIPINPLCRLATFLRIWQQLWQWLLRELGRPGDTVCFN